MDTTPHIDIDALAGILETRTLANLPVLYLSGPMTGHPEYNFPAFNEAARRLRALGFPVLNPADFGVRPGLSYHDILFRDLEMLGRADILVQLEGWADSRGSTLESGVARDLGKPTIPIDDLPGKVLLHYFTVDELKARGLLDKKRQEMMVGIDEDGRLVFGTRRSLKQLERLCALVANGGVDDEEE